jgi:hypothetical protein
MEKRFNLGTTRDAGSREGELFVSYKKRNKQIGVARGFSNRSSS